jgi:hypothetical protein
MIGENINLLSTDERRRKLYRVVGGHMDGAIVHLYNEGMNPITFHAIHHCWLPGDAEGKSLWLAADRLEPLTDAEAGEFEAKIRAAVPDLVGYDNGR